MAKNDKNNTKNANEGIRYGPRTGGDYRRSHDAFTGYNDCFYRDRFSDGRISGQRSRGTVGFHCLSAGSCCGDTCCGMGRRTFWRTALLDDGSCDLPDRFFFVRCFSGAAGIGGMPCAAGLWSGLSWISVCSGTVRSLRRRRPCFSREAPCMRLSSYFRYSGSARSERLHWRRR